MREEVIPAAQESSVPLRRGDSKGAELAGGADRKGCALGKTVVLNITTSSIWRQPLSPSVKTCPYTLFKYKVQLFGLRVLFWVGLNVLCISSSFFFPACAF